MNLPTPCTMEDLALHLSGMVSNEVQNLTGQPIHSSFCRCDHQSSRPDGEHTAMKNFTAAEVDDKVRNTARRQLLSEIRQEVEKLERGDPDESAVTGRPCMYENKHGHYIFRQDVLDLLDRLEQQP